MKKIIFIFLFISIVAHSNAFSQEIKIVYKIPEEKFQQIYSALSHEYRKKQPNRDYNGDGRPDWTKEKHLREIIRFIIVKKIEFISDKFAAKQAKEDNRPDFNAFR